MCNRHTFGGPPDRLYRARLVLPDRAPNPRLKRPRSGRLPPAAVLGKGASTWAVKEIAGSVATSRADGGLQDRGSTGEKNSGQGLCSRSKIRQFWFQIG